MSSSDKTVVASDGTKYTVKNDGTLEKASSSSSGGLIGVLVGAVENTIKAGVDAVHPSTSKSNSKK